MLVDVHLNWLNWFHFLILVVVQLVFLIGCMIFFVTFPRCHKDILLNSFFPGIARFLNSLPAECFPLTYDLNGFKSRVIRNLFSLGSFYIAFLYDLHLFLRFFEITSFAAAAQLRKKIARRQVS